MLNPQNILELIIPTDHNIPDESYLYINSKLTSNGIEVQLKGKNYPLSYTETIWKKTPASIQEALLDNLALATTMHLPMIFDIKGLVFNTGRPILEPYFFQNFIKDIPSCAEVDGTNIDDNINRFLETEYQFLDPVIKYPGLDKVDSPYRAIIGLTFGKDSLLTYGLANELDLDPAIVYIVEQSMTHEYHHKTELAKHFKKEFNKELQILIHETGKLRDYNYLGIQASEFGWGLQNTEYAIDLIPYAYALQGKYLFFGNEQSCAESHLNLDNRWRVHTCYDQSHLWTKHVDQITQLFSGRSVLTGSLIEPLMDIMIQYTLVHRYPELAKYQMSCFTYNDAGFDYRWCHNCPVCADMFLLAKAVGVNPLQIGLKKNMLDKQFKDQYYVFEPVETFHLYRDMQLFAFYLATKRNCKDPLVEEFKTLPVYEEAKTREDELVHRFLSMYDSITIPSELKSPVLSIFKEELNSFEY